MSKETCSGCEKIIPKMLEMALSVVADFGLPAIGCLVIVHMYYEYRWNQINKKQEELDKELLELENETIKNANEVRSESQKRLDYIVDRLQSGEASTEEMLALVVRSMIALKTDIQESYLTTKEFRSQQHDDIMHNAKERAASSERSQAVFDEIRDEFERVNHRINELVTSQTNMGTFGKGPAPANYGKVSRRKPILNSIEAQEEVLEESLAHIEPMLEMEETDTEFHRLNVKEMAGEPEKYESIVPTSFGALNTRDC